MLQAGHGLRQHESEGIFAGSARSGKDECGRHACRRDRLPQVADSRLISYKLIEAHVDETSKNKGRTADSLNRDRMMVERTADPSHHRYLILLEAPPSPLSSRPERTRISCHAAPDRAACAALRKESRIKFVNAINLDRKSGVAQRRDLRCAPAFSQMCFLRR